MSQRTIKIIDYGSDKGFGRYVVREGSELIYGGNSHTFALAAVNDWFVFGWPEIPAPERIETEVRELNMREFANGLLETANGPSYLREGK